MRKITMGEKIEKELKWAVLGTGIIANEMAQALEKMGKKLYAVANRTHSKAVEFLCQAAGHEWLGSEYATTGQYQL